MILLSDEDRRRAFVAWLRTGRLPPAPSDDQLEVKFKPWHDPANGRFTFAGSGRHFGAYAVDRAGAGDRTAGTSRRREPTKLPAGARSAAITRRAEPTQPQRVVASVLRSASRPNPLVEFARGAADGLYDTAAGTAEAAYSVLTTSPAITARNAGLAVAGTIDAAIAAEDMPARIRISRAAGAVANASAHDLGHSAGSAAGSAALAVVPGAALSKVSALRRLRVAGPHGVTYDPLQVGWVKENLGRETPAKRYNDMAPGSRPNQAPTLMRTMPNNSQRPVKFDGIQGEYFIDRKFSIRDQSRARAQLLRQSDVLAQHRLIGIWEVPN